MRRPRLTCQTRRRRDATPCRLGRHMLPRKAGEGDRRRRWRGQPPVPCSACCYIPSKSFQDRGGRSPLHHASGCFAPLAMTQGRDIADDRRDGPFRPGAGVGLWRSSMRSCRSSGTSRRDGRLIAVAPPVALIAGFVFTALFLRARSTYAHVVSDFSLVNVIENSVLDEAARSTRSPACGGTTRARCCSGFSFSRSSPPPWRSPRAACRRICAPSCLAVQSWIASAFLLFILLTSDPFTRTLWRPPSRDRISIRCSRTHGSRDPPAAALPRLRRLLHDVLVCCRRADRRPRRRGLGALRAGHGR